MQKFDRSLENSVAEAISGLRERFPGSHIEWDLDPHDRFVIADIMFGAESSRAEWLDALAAILDAHRMKAVAPLPNARPEVLDAFTQAGYGFDVEGNAVRAGLCRRDEAAEVVMTAKIRELDRRYQDVYFEWAYSQDGALVLQHIEAARTRPERRVEEYLRELCGHLAETGTMFMVAEGARTEWLDFRLEEAGFSGGEGGVYVPAHVDAPTL